MPSPKELLKQATARYMADLLKQSRARWAALPESAKRAYIRNWEDDFYASELRSRGVES